MEQNTIHPTNYADGQIKSVSQMLIIDGYRVKINYLPPRTKEGKDDVLGNIQKALLANIAKIKVYDKFAHFSAECDNDDVNCSLKTEY